MSRRQYRFWAGERGEGQQDCVRTPGLDVHGHDRLGGDLGLGRFLLLVGSQAFLADLGGLGVLLLFAAEQVDVVLIGGRGLGRGGVDGGLGGLGGVGGECGAHGWRFVG